MRGTSTGAQIPEAPISAIEGCKPPLGQTLRHSEQRMHLENRSPASAPGGSSWWAWFNSFGMDGIEFQQEERRGADPGRPQQVPPPEIVRLTNGRRGFQRETGGFERAAIQAAQADRALGRV